MFIVIGKDTNNISYTVRCGLGFLATDYKRFLHSPAGPQGQNMRPNRFSHSMNTVLFVNATIGFSENLFLIGSPTRVTDTSSATLDHIFTTSPEMHYNSGVLPITLSDHYCTCTILDLKSPVNMKKIVKCRNYNKFSA